MKIYISADIEGIGCVVRGEHAAVSGREYAVARQRMTAEVNAAVQGAFAAGADEVVVCDAHNVGINLIAETLDTRATLIMGGPRPLAMMDGIDDSYDAVFLVGYHACAGTAQAVIAHVYTARIASVRINDIKLGEIGLSAMVAGWFGVPVALVTGDQATAAEAGALLGDVEVAEVKTAIGAYAAHCMHPRKSAEKIELCARRALAQIETCKPFKIDGPARLQVRFTTASGADRMMRMPGVYRENGTTVGWDGQNCLEAFRAFVTMSDLVDLTPYV